MRKRLISAGVEHAGVEDRVWLHLPEIAEVEVSSEDTARPIEDALCSNDSEGWQAGAAGKQLIRLLFDEPQNLKLIELLFREPNVERQHEFVLRWSAGNGEPLREIVRQQYQFSPGGSVEELENYEVNLVGVRLLELEITPDRSGGSARATLARMRLA